MKTLNYITAKNISKCYADNCNLIINIGIIVCIIILFTYIYTKYKTIKKEEWISKITKYICCTIFIISILGMIGINKNPNYIVIFCGLMIECIITMAFLWLVYIYINNKIKEWIYIHRWNITICSIIFIISILGIYTMFGVFNDGKWYIHENTRFSTDISDWGDFATCLTALFALISIYLAYRAFMGQVNASRRASFDATFTQIFAQHNTLRARVADKNRNLFTVFIEYYELNHEIIRRRLENGNNTIITELYNNFNIQDILDFKNYFKYIYHEITTVTEQEEDILDENAKKRYIGLIQSQMNNDELFCYFINQIAHYDEYSEKDSKVKEYAQTLKRYNFFGELYNINPKSRNMSEQRIYRFVQELRQAEKNRSTRTTFNKRR